MVKLTDYFPSQTLSTAGKEFLDNHMGILFDQRKDKQRTNVKLSAHYTAGNKFITVDGVPMDFKIGDIVSITNDIGDNVVTPYVVYDPDVGSDRTIRLTSVDYLKCEVRKVVSISSKTVELDYPFDNDYNINTTLTITLNDNIGRTLILEDVAITSDSALKTSGITGDSILNNYRIYTDPVIGDIYDIPLTSKTLFPVYPDIGSIVVSYIEPTTLHRVELNKGIDFFVDSTQYTVNGVTVPQNANKDIKLVIKRDSSVAKPSSVTGIPIFRVLMIEYQPCIPSGITVSDAAIQLNYCHGSYMRQSSIVFDSNGDFLSRFPEKSTNLMASGDEIADWIRLKTDYAIANYRYLTGVDNRYDVLPMKQEELVKESKNIYSIKGTKGSISNLIAITGVNVEALEEEYALAIQDGIDRYEVFALNQTQIPTYDFVKTLHEFKDSGSPIYKNVTAGYGNSGAYAHESYYGDFYLRFAIGSLCDCQIGVTTAFIDYTPTNIDCAIELTSAGAMNLVVNGVVQTASVGTYIVGDILTVSSEGGVYKAYQNGTLLGTFTLTTTPRLPIVAFSSINCSITNVTIENAGVVKEVFWYESIGTIRGRSILQRRLMDIIPSSVYETAATIITPNLGYTIDVYGSTEYGSPAAPSIIPGWTDYELRLVYAYMFTRVPTFNPVFHATIHEAMRVKSAIDTSSYNYRELISLSSFSTTINRGSKTLYSGTGLDIKTELAQVVDLTRPFTRHMSDDDFVERIDTQELDAAYIGHYERMFASSEYITILNAAATPFNVGLYALNSTGTAVQIGSTMLNSAGTPFNVGTVVSTQLLG